MDLSNVADSVTLHVVQGAYWGPWVITLGPTDAPLDLTGATAAAHIRKKANGDVVTSFAVEIVPLEGQVILVLDETRSAKIPAANDPASPESRSVFDLVVKDVTLNTIQVVRGDIRGYPLVTKEV